MKFHSSGHNDYLKALKKAYDQSVQDVENNAELTIAEKTAALMQLHKEYSAKRKKASFGSFIAE